MHLGQHVQRKGSWICRYSSILPEPASLPKKPRGFFGYSLVKLAERYQQNYIQHEALEDSMVLRRMVGEEAFNKLNPDFTQSYSDLMQIHGSGIGNGDLY